MAEPQRKPELRVLSGGNDASEPVPPPPAPVPQGLDIGVYIGAGVVFALSFLFAFSVVFIGFNTLYSGG